MRGAVSHFLRFSSPDPERLRADVELVRAKLREAEAKGDSIGVLDHAGSLGGMLTTDRRESEAYQLMVPLLPMVRAYASSEEAAWLLHSLATAAQYAGHRGEAHGWFNEALQMARAHGWQRLEHFVLHHWGRCLAEEGSFGQARACFQQSLALREAMGDSRQESSRKALAELARLESLEK